MFNFNFINHTQEGSLPTQQGRYAPFHLEVCTSESLDMASYLDFLIADVIRANCTSNASLFNILTNFMLGTDATNHGGWDGERMIGFRALTAWRMTYDNFVEPSRNADWNEQVTEANRVPNAFITIRELFKTFAIGKFMELPPSADNRTHPDFVALKQFVEHHDASVRQNPFNEMGKPKPLLANQLEKYNADYLREYCDHPDPAKKGNYARLLYTFLANQQNAGIAERRRSARRMKQFDDVSMFDMLEGHDLNDEGPIYQTSGYQTRTRPVPTISPSVTEMIAAHDEDRNSEEKESLQDNAVQVNDVQINHTPRETDEILDSEATYPVSDYEVAKEVWDVYRNPCFTTNPVTKERFTKEEFGDDFMTVDENKTASIVVKTPEALESNIAKFHRFNTPIGAFVNNFRCKENEDHYLQSEVVKVYNGFTLNDLDEELPCEFEGITTLNLFEKTLYKLADEEKSLYEANEIEAARLVTKRIFQLQLVFDHLKYLHGKDPLYITTRPYGFERSLSQVDMVRQFFGKFWMQDLDYKLTTVRGQDLILLDPMDHLVCEKLNQYMKKMNGNLAKDGLGNWIGFQPAKGMYLALQQRHTTKKVSDICVMYIYTDEYDFSLLEEPQVEEVEPEVIEENEMEVATVDTKHEGIVEIIEDTRESGLAFDIVSERFKTEDTFTRISKRFELEKSLGETELILVDSTAPCIGFTVDVNTYDFIQVLQNEVESNYNKLQDIGDLLEAYDLGAGSPMYHYLSSEIMKLVNRKAQLEGLQQPLTFNGDVFNDFGKWLENEIVDDYDGTGAICKLIEDFIWDWTRELVGTFRTHSKDGKYRITKGELSIRIDTGLDKTQLGIGGSLLKSAVISNIIESSISHINKTKKDTYPTCNPTEVEFITKDGVVLVGRNTDGEWVATLTE